MEDFDWELLNNSESDSVPEEFHVGDPDSDADDSIIRRYYFSIDSHHNYAATAAKTPSEQGSVVSDNPSWIEPGSDEAQSLFPVRTNSGDVWSDSSTGDGDRPPPDTMMGSVGGGATEHVGLENSFLDSNPDTDGPFSANLDFMDDVVGETFAGAEGSGAWADQGEISEAREEEVVAEVLPVPDGLVEKEVVVHCEEDEAGERGEVVSMEGKLVESKEKTTRVVWWKVPWELLKCCVFRARPVWSLSVAAAIMGFVILGRRLYRMKRKTQSMQLKFNVDDKKVPQLISHAARLNEAFSVVRRVPVIRPSLPTQPGVAPWPVMSLR